jgi:hypothetical protein
MRGLAADLDLPPEQLVAMVESAAVRIALRDAATLAGSAAASLVSLGPQSAGLAGECSRIEAALARLAAVGGPLATGDQVRSGPSSG